MFTVIHNAPGGELHKFTAEDGEEAAKTLSEYLLDGFALIGGDSFIVIEDSEDE